MSGVVRMVLKVFLSTILFAIYVGQIQGQDIYCPFPDGIDVQDKEAECAKFNACYWTGSNCYLISNTDYGYEVVSPPQATATGFTLQLQRISPIYTMFEEDIQNLTFELINHEDYHFQIKITDTDNERYEVPVPLNLPSTPGTDPMYSVSVSSNVGDPFAFTVTRNSNGNTLFDIKGPLIYEKQFIQLTTSLMSEYLYGFGESTHTTFKRPFNENCAIFARDQPIGTELMNEYGHHPYYMVVEDNNGNSHSVLYFNSNAMEYNTFMDGSTHSLTLRAIGGIVDMHFFLGPTPEDLNIQYINMIGLPVFPTYYMLGFQLSRWGYETLDDIKEVVDQMRAAGIPQDIQTFDINYMENYRDFTYDQVNYAGLPEYLDELRTWNIRSTLILDPAIVIDWDNYPPAQRGKDLDVYIKWTTDFLIPDDQCSTCEDYVVGYCWPNNKTVMPDFLNPNTSIWWENELTLMYYDLDLKWDAMWIDMNEPANFGTDTARPWNYPPGLPDWSLKCPYNDLDSPPYPTMTTRSGGTESHRISDHTICMSSKQTDGTNTYFHYDVHSLYGWSHVKVTYENLVNMFPGKRQNVLVRSTFPSSGKYGVHWLGDNTANWDHMKMSVIGMMEFNMFGIPYVGADVCGFFGDTTEEMCGRWTELGAFYPFNRNHNADGYAPQHPSLWESVTAIAIKYYNLRYMYNPYLYDLLYRAHVYGNSVVRPLLNNFPTDLTARDVDDQFMWADGFMVAPIMDPGVVSRDVYFPEGNWYDLIVGNLVATGPTTLFDVSAPFDVILVYARGGVVYPFQGPAMTTAESRLNPFGLTVALDETESAVGEIFWDDGESDYSASTSFLATLDFSSNILTMVVGNDLTAAAGLNIETLQFFGYPSNPTDITVNGNSLDNSAWTFDATTLVLNVTISVPLNADLTVVLS